MRPPEELRAPTPADRSFFSLLGELKDDCIKLGQQKIKLTRLQITSHAAQVRKYSTITAAGGVTAVTGLVVLLIGLSNWIALLFGPASIPLAAGHTIVGGVVTAAGGLTAYLASQKLPDGSMLPGSTIADVISETEDVAEDITES